MNKGYIYLCIAIIGEVFGASMLKASEGFTILMPVIGLIVGMGSAFVFLSLCLKKLPLSLVYAIWSGVGTAATALLGVFIWNEPFGILTGVGILFIIGGVVLLNTSKVANTTATVSNT
ncbi:multidrug efflux SMR transporter [Paenibacillus sp. 276b]|uniref:DMT family transporter n=1 Tax=Paenibacillus sp. 276b TaxID=1566277 RepID=UPI00089D5156|nr:multidrug efflux SMR transporter [Paenibacillus sp. 276b]SEA60493.1 multidrug resistance protein EbrB [Paenibacillus sp. 276b]